MKSFKGLHMGFQMFSQWKSFTNSHSFRETQDNRLYSVWWLPRANICTYHTPQGLSADARHCKPPEFFMMCGKFLSAKESQALLDIYVLLRGMNEQKEVNQRGISSLFCITIIPEMATEYEKGPESLELATLLRKSEILH